MARVRALRRGFAALLCALLAVWMLGAPGACARAEAEGLLRIGVTVRPEGLIEPGDVMLNFTIENVSEETARNVYLSSADGLLFELVGEIAPGESRSFSRQHSVTAEELEAGEIAYTISHDDPGDANVKVNYGVRAQIRHSDAQPAVEFTRQFSSRSVSAGGTLTITYRLCNTGNVPLSDLQVTDSLGNYSGRVEALDTGESRTLISRVALAESSISSAQLTYRAEGSQDVQTQSLADAAIRVAAAGLDSVFTVGQSAFAKNTANVVLTLSNAGDVDYRDLCVIDDVYGGVIADELSLSAGSDPLEVSHAYDLRGDEGFRWRVTGTSESGEPVDLVTETLHLAPPEAGAPEALRLTVFPLTPRIRRAGDVKMRVRIENAGGVELRDLVLSEAGLGEMHSFAVLGADGAIERDFIVHVNGDSSFNFTVRGVDAGDAEVSATAENVAVAIAADGALPEGEEERLIEFTGGSIKIGGSSTFALLLITGIVVLLALIIALIVATRRARLERQLRAAAERQRRREELGKTNRFTPVRGSQNQNPSAKTRSKGRNS